MVVIRIFFFVFFVLFFSACGPSTPEDFREEGEALTRSLIHELGAIHNRNDLACAGPRLKALFNELVSIAIKARSRGAAPLAKTAENTSLNERLRQELARIYRLNGGKRLIERYQEEALVHLDQYERDRSIYPTNY